MLFLLTMLPSDFPEVSEYPFLKKLLKMQIDMQINDVRTMFQLPKHEVGLDAGCNFAITAILLNIISGSSVLFFNIDPTNPISVFKSGKRGERFRGLLEKYYPWVGDDDLPTQECIELLYGQTRNPLTHSLGLDKPINRQIVLSKEAITITQINELEDSQSRPPWAQKTIIRLKSTGSYEELAISIPALYWGVHRLLHNLFSDSIQVGSAELLAKSLLS
jgi:hypothetical protein